MSTPSIDPDGQRRHRRYFILILVGVLLLVFLYMVASIIAGVIAGILLWVMTRPIYDRILKRTRERSGLAAGISVLATVLVVVVPLTVIVLIATADALRLAGDIQTWIPSVQAKFHEWMDLLSRGGLSFFGYQLSPELISGKIGDLTTTVGQFLLQLTQRTASSIAAAMLMLFVALYTLYYFYVDGDRFLGWLKDTVPLEPKQTGQLIDSFFSTSIATLKTIGILGVVQGVAAGIAYFVIGVPAPFFLTILTIISTVIPAVGAALVIVPVTVGLFIAGQTGWAIALLVWYVAVVSNLDNFLRPHLMHRSIRLHQLIIFVVTIGGIARYGFFGVFIGPVIAALLNASLNIYREVYPRSVPVQTSPV
jgi:predicted PurR-regulated permease PerM